MKENRRRQIEELVIQKKSISMQELCEQLKVSMNTVRSDVNNLVQAGVVEKVYGGIRLREHEDIPLYENRSVQQTDCRCRIARAAERLIADGDIIYIDSGTTTMRLLDYLDPQKRITVVTASVSVLVRAQAMSNLTLMVLPGLYDKRTNALLDNSTVEYLSRFKHTKAFLGVSSIAANGELGVSNWLEYELKRSAIAHSQESYLLVDATKYGRAGLLTFSSIDQMAAVVTDTDMQDSFVSLCQSKKITIYQV